MATVALAYDVSNAAPGTFTEPAPRDDQGNSVPSIPTATYSEGGVGTRYGTSAWVYKDGMDAEFKYEGSYREFQEQTGQGTNTQGGYGPGYYEFNATAQDTGPHDGYDTANNKCESCHAAHRAADSYRLMRANNIDDVCIYCHVGDHKHAIRGAYYRSGSDGIYTRNGHTMGAGPFIPDSTVKMWLSTRTIQVINSNGIPQSISYSVREYDSQRNQMFYWTSYRSTYHALGWIRNGPTYLSCVSCHQPHNADALIWKPGNLTNGFKLLRASPSGSTVRVDRMVNFTPITVEDRAEISDMIMVPNNRVTRNVTGNNGNSSIATFPASTDGNRVIWTTWKGPDFDLVEANGVPRLSVWCADCHNLNIGHYESVAGIAAIGLRASSLHSDRTHTSSGSIMECWNCHSSNMPVTDNDITNYGVPVGAGGCFKCHYYNDGDLYYRAFRWVAAISDFPHSGAPGGFKLLTEQTANTAVSNTAQGNINFGVSNSDQSLDGFCLRCHDMIGSAM